VQERHSPSTCSPRRGPFAGFLPLFFGDIGGACGMVAVALDALITFTIEAALVGCWTAERDGEAALAGRIGGFGGIWWRRCLRDGGARLYMALQYYQNIPTVSFAGCTDGGA